MLEAKEPLQPLSYVQGQVTIVKGFCDVAKTHPQWALAHTMRVPLWWEHRKHHLVCLSCRQLPGSPLCPSTCSRQCRTCTWRPSHILMRALCPSTSTSSRPTLHPKLISWKVCAASRLWHPNHLPSFQCVLLCRLYMYTRAVNQIGTRAEARPNQQHVVGQVMVMRDPYWTSQLKYHHHHHHHHRH